MWSAAGRQGQRVWQPSGSCIVDRKLVGMMRLANSNLP
jgi:hypothetical protein